jgi:hypothetical protein
MRRVLLGGTGGKMADQHMAYLRLCFSTLAASASALSTPMASSLTERERARARARERASAREPAAAAKTRYTSNLALPICRTTHASELVSKRGGARATRHTHTHKHTHKHTQTHTHNTTHTQHTHTVVHWRTRAASKALRQCEVCSVISAQLS